MPKKKKKSSLKVLEYNATKLIRQEYMDYDYVDKLSPEEKQWLANFTDEYYNASVGKQSDEGKNTHFHQSKELVKDSQHRNNLRNNDVYGKARASKTIINKDYNLASEYIDVEADSVINRTEDAVIAVLDEANNLRNSSKDTDDKSNNTD